MFSGTNSKAVTSEEYTRMVNVSPLTHIASVVTPTLLLLGAKDQRVPMSQGLAWYHALVAKGVATRLYVYPNDGHPLSSVEAEVINLVCLLVLILSCRRMDFVALQSGLPNTCDRMN